MSHLFIVKDTFNEDISGWDTSKVTNMGGMFYHAAAFNQPIGQWDTRQVTTMEEMFEGATAFSQDLSHWCVSSIGEPYGFGNSDGTNPSWGTCPCTTSNLANTDCIALDNDNINPAVSAWIDIDSATAIATYGHIKDW